MKIAITADCHLNPNYLERRDILKKIFEEINSRKIDKLFILGDLFDRAQQNYSEFDALLKEFPNIEVYLIPGNHDYNVLKTILYYLILKLLLNLNFFLLII